MPASFINCVKQGGRVKTIKGKNKKYGLEKGQYRYICFLDKKMYLGEIKTKKK